MPSLTPGTRLGPYEVLVAIGAGGMGEVYKARDTRLDRIVAIKVLANGLAADPQSRERFEREAKAISSLNHPNICVLHDIGRSEVRSPEGLRHFTTDQAQGFRAAGVVPDSDGADVAQGFSPAEVDFLVMEFLEGETLAARLTRGPGRLPRAVPAARSEPMFAASPDASSSPSRISPPMTVDEALGVAIQIAGALDRAHRQGIVHRDLKPGNVMLTRPESSSKSGARVKLLDFGLARLTRAGGTRSGGTGDGGDGHGLVSLADLSTPTMSSPLTMKGMMLGTLQYMSPEQIEGKEIDARTDIFAFGAVLYEMLTGQRPFNGKSQASLIGAILDHDPPRVMSFLPAMPPMLDEIVARCLAKDPDDRWQTARDLMRQLEWVAARIAVTAEAVTEGFAASQLSARARIVRVGAALAAGAAIAVAAVAWVLWPKPSAPPIVSRFAIALPESQAFTRTGRHIVALSPDGTRLVYVANQQLYLRAMHELMAAPISGTENADPSEPIFSPDGQWVAFWSGNQLKKVPVTGGTPVTLSAANNPLGASWAGDRILLGQLDPRGIVAVPANGGAPTLLVTINEKNAEQAYGPQLVGGGQAVLFTLRTGEGAWDDAAIVVHDLKTGRRTVLVNGGTDGHVLPTGHLVYSRDGTLFAVPFDETRLAVTGGPVPVQQGIGGATGGPGATQAAWSVSGSLVFVLGGASSYGDRALVWINRQGKEERAAAPLRPYGFQYETAPVKVSPDGTRVALTIVPDSVRSTPAARQSSTSGPDIWVLDIARGALTRLTFTGEGAVPVWTPDSRRVCYVSVGIHRTAFCQSADGTGQPQTLVTAGGLIAVSSFSPDGSRALVTMASGKTGNDIMMATIGPSTEVRPLITTPYDESYAAVSPDGRWLAYQSNESGRFEIYVRPFPDVEKGRWQVSTDGAVEPRWSSNGRELFFFNGLGWGVSGAGFVSRTALMSVAVQTGSGFVAGTPSEVIKWPSAAGSAYDVAPDGRFLVNVPALSATTEATGRPQMVIVQHWFDELKARVPTHR
jgi:serine/threonine-protein kinase